VKFVATAFGGYMESTPGIYISYNSEIDGQVGVQSSFASLP